MFVLYNESRGRYRSRLGRHTWTDNAQHAQIFYSRYILEKDVKWLRMWYTKPENWRVWERDVQTSAAVAELRDLLLGAEIREVIPTFVQKGQ